MPSLLLVARTVAVLLPSSVPNVIGAFSVTSQVGEFAVDALCWDLEFSASWAFGYLVMVIVDLASDLPVADPLGMVEMLA